MLHSPNVGVLRLLSPQPGHPPVAAVLSSAISPTPGSTSSGDPSVTSNSRPFLPSFLAQGGDLAVGVRGGRGDGGVILHPTLCSPPAPLPCAHLCTPTPCSLPLHPYPVFIPLDPYPVLTFPGPLPHVHLPCILTPWSSLVLLPSVHPLHLYPVLTPPPRTPTLCSRFALLPHVHPPPLPILCSPENSGALCLFSAPGHMDTSLTGAPGEGERLCQ